MNNQRRQEIQKHLFHIYAIPQTIRVPHEQYARNFIRYSFMSRTDTFSRFPMENQANDIYTVLWRTHQTQP